MDGTDENKQPQGGGPMTAQGAALGTDANHIGKPQRGGAKRMHDGDTVLVGRLSMRNLLGIR